MRIQCVSTGSAGNCYIVEDKNGNYLVLDCGVSYRSLIPNLKKVPDAALVTHIHGDHAGHARDFIKRGITVCAPHDVCENLGRNGLAYKLPRRYSTYHRKTETYDGFNVGHWHIQPFPVKHEAGIETVGYIIVSKIEKKVLLYATDCCELPPKLGFKFKRGERLISHPFDEMIIECNYDNYTVVDAMLKSDDKGRSIAKQAYRHMGLRNLVKWLSNQDLSGLSTIHICHMSNRHANERLIYDTLVRETGKNIIIF